MKSKIKKISKSSVSVVLALCMLITTALVGVVFTDAAVIKTSDAVSANVEETPVGAQVQEEAQLGASLNEESVGAASTAANFWLIGNFTGSNWDSNQTSKKIDSSYNSGTGKYYIEVSVPTSGSKCFALWNGSKRYAPATQHASPASSNSTQNDHIGDYNHTGNSWEYKGSASKIRICVDETTGLGSNKGNDYGWYPYVWVEDVDSSAQYTVFAKDTTIRWNNSTQTGILTGHADTTILSSSINVTNITDHTDWGGNANAVEATATEGGTIKVQTTIDAANKDKYYVKAFCVNGISYNVITKAQADANTTGVYTADIPVTADMNDDGTGKIEITPIFYLKDESNVINFIVEGFDGTIREKWGNTISVFAYFNGGNDTLLGGFPGQPLVNDGGTIYFQLPKDDGNGKEIQGVTLSNYHLDSIHSNNCGFTSSNMQTYDYDNFYKIVKEHNDAKNIVLSLRYETSKDNFDDSRSYPSTATLSNYNTTHQLTNYNGDAVNIFGTKLTEAQKSNGAIYAISNGYVNNYQGYYATEWVIYDQNRNLIGAIPSSALVLTESSHFSNYATTKDSDGTVYANQLSTYQSVYNSLASYTDRPVMVSYEKAITRDVSINNGHPTKRESALRNDGQWYFTTTADQIQSKIRVEISNDNGTTWTTDSFVGDTNTTQTAKVQAYFTNTEFSGNTVSNYVDVNANNSFTYTAVEKGKYEFVGWYRENGTTFKQITTSLNGSTVMLASDTYVARFMYVEKGSLVISHSVDSNSTGSGTAYISAKVKYTYHDTDTDSDVDVEVPFAETTGSIDINDTYIRSDQGTYQIEVTLRTTAGTNSIFKSYSLDTTTDVDVTTAKFFNGTTSGADTTSGTRTITFTVSDLYDGNSQIVEEIDYYSLLAATDEYYSIQYNYTSRSWGNQAFTVEGTFTSEELAAHVNSSTHVVDADFISDKVPEESNYGQTITFDFDTAATVANQSYNSSTRVHTITVNSTATSDIKKTALFNLNYTYNTTTKQFTAQDIATFDDDESNIYGGTADDGAESFSVEVDYKSSGFEVNGEFVTAPYYIVYSDGSRKFFNHWTVTRTRDNQVFYCYSRKFNLAAYDNYTVEPVFQAGWYDANIIESGNSGFSASIAYNGATRNQWNKGDSGSVPYTSWETAADRIFVDFDLAFNYYGHELNSYSNGLSYTNDAGETVTVSGANNIKFGIVMERAADLVTGHNDADYYKNLYSSQDAANTAAVQTFIENGGTGTLGTSSAAVEKKVINSIIGKNNSQTGSGKPVQNVISIRNKLEYGYSFGNTRGVEGGTGDAAFVDVPDKNYAYRAYAYIYDVTAGTAAVSAPVYFTFIDIATK